MHAYPRSFANRLQRYTSTLGHLLSQAGKDKYGIINGTLSVLYHTCLPEIICKSTPALQIHAWLFGHLLSQCRPGAIFSKILSDGDIELSTSLKDGENNEEGIEEDDAEDEDVELAPAFLSFLSFLSFFSFLSLGSTFSSRSDNFMFGFSLAGLWVFLVVEDTGLPSR